MTVKEIPVRVVGPGSQPGAEADAPLWSWTPDATVAFWRRRHDRWLYVWLFAMT